MDTGRQIESHLGSYLYPVRTVNHSQSVEIYNYQETRYKTLLLDRDMDTLQFKIINKEPERQ